VCVCVCVCGVCVCVCVYVLIERVCVLFIGTLYSFRSQYTNETCFVSEASIPTKHAELGCGRYDNKAMYCVTTCYALAI